MTSIFCFLRKRTIDFFQEKTIFSSALVCFLVGLCLFAACQSPKQNTTLFSGNIMTINYRILIGKTLTAEQKIEVQHIINQTFQEINLIYNKWNPDSEVSQINRLKANTPFFLSEQLAYFLTQVDYYFNLTKGYFDPTIEPLQQLWISYLNQNKEPPSQEIEAIQATIGWNRFIIQNGILYKTNANARLDFGGIAKGYCVDLIIERLMAKGFINLYVEWGGDIRAIGQHPSKRPWHIFIAKPRSADPTQAIAHVDLADKAIATSGDYFQYWSIINSKGLETKYCHVFNPLTYRPCEIKEGSITSVSLTAKDCMTADALAKVFMLFESKQEAETWFLELKEHYPETECWIVYN